MKSGKSLVDSQPGLVWADGDFYLPMLAHSGLTALVPGVADVHRRLFLRRAAIIEPELLLTLRRVKSDNDDALLAWGVRWHLTDAWCLALAHETVRWYALQPAAEGWYFDGRGICAGHFPFPIEPLQLKAFYYDPTWRSRSAFKRSVLEHVNQALESYSDGVESAALAAGLKRAPHKREKEHFDWLARYQIKGESYTSIAQTASYKFKGGRQTVRKAIVDLAGYLALTLRAST